MYVPKLDQYNCSLSLEFRPYYCLHNKYVATSARVATGTEKDTDEAPLQLSLSQTLQCLILKEPATACKVLEAVLSRERQVWFMSVGLLSRQVRMVVPVSRTILWQYLGAPDTLLISSVGRMDRRNCVL